MCTSAAQLVVFWCKDLNYGVNKEEPRYLWTKWPTVSWFKASNGPRHDEITECKWFLCFVVRTSAKVTLTYNMHAEQMQLTLRSSSFWTLQLKETHCIKFGESQKEMMNWFPQQLLTHWYIFCPKVLLSYSALFAIMLHDKTYWWNNSRTV